MVISYMDGEALTLEEGDKKIIIEKTVDALMEELLCKYEEFAKKTSSEMDVKALPLE